MKKILLLFLCISAMQLNGGIKHYVTNLAKKRKESQIRAKQQRIEKNEKAKEQMLKEIEQEKCNGKNCTESCVYTIRGTPFNNFVIYQPTNPNCEKKVRVLESH